jgi:hypothetical protein
VNQKTDEKFSEEQLEDLSPPAPKETDADDPSEAERFPEWTGQRSKFSIAPDVGHVIRDGNVCAYQTPCIEP